MGTPWIVWMAFFVAMAGGVVRGGLAEVEKVPAGCKVVGRAGTFQGLVEKMKPVLTFPMWEGGQMMLWTRDDEKGRRSFSLASVVQVRAAGKRVECVVLDAGGEPIQGQAGILGRTTIAVSTGKAALNLEGGFQWARVAGEDSKRGTVYEIGSFTEYPGCGVQEHRVMVMQTEKGAWRFLCSYTGNSRDGLAYRIEVKAQVEWVGTAAMPLVRVVEKSEHPERGARDVPWYTECVYVWAGTKMSKVKEVSYVVVRKGETLSGICRNVAESVDEAIEGERKKKTIEKMKREILKANPEVKADRVEVGQRLVVPEAAYEDFVGGC